MTLRRRLGLLTGAAVALTVILASALVYFLVRDNLRGDVDDDLRAQADRAANRVDQVRSTLPADVAAEGGLEAVIGGGPPPGAPGPGLQPPAGPTQAAGGQASGQRAGSGQGSASGQPQGGAQGPGPPDVLAFPAPAPGDPAAIGQFISAGGEVVPTPGTTVSIPVSDAAKQAAADGETRFDDVDVDGTPLRVLTQPVGDGAAIQVAASLQSTEDTLSTLVLILLLVSAGAVALAAGLGPVVARTALAPAAEVSDAAEEVARTHDLTRRIETTGDDELGRLTRSFNEMMEALELSEASQRRLVADASHELRTPLAVLRTNIETLGRVHDMTDDERHRLIADVTDEIEEMTELVADVVELAREPGVDEMARQDLDLGELTRDAVARAERRFRELTFESRIEPAIVSGDPQRLDRAIYNLLDNAGKWAPAGSTVVVDARGGRVSVRDHGPGFDPKDLPKVFDRFWRSDEARGKHGSGLGLAIVQRVAEEHGGHAAAANAEGGGAVVEIRLPA